MPLSISRLEIKNFRNFVHLELDPFPASAVIVGENGIGKSNLLYALRLVLDPGLPDTRRQLSAEDVSDYADDSFESGVEVRITVDLTGFDDDDSAKGALDGCIIAIAPYVARLTYLFRPLVELADPAEALDHADSPVLTSNDYEWVLFGGDDESSDARRIRRAITLSVLPAMRDAVADLAVPSRSPLPELLEEAGPERSILEGAAKRIGRVMDTLAADDSLTTLADGISLRMKRMVGPQLDVEPTLGFAPGRPIQLLRSIRMFIDRERSRSVSDTSTGNANVVYLALLLERFAVRRRSDRVVATLLGVEEPEAHLHPGLQRHLFGYLLRHGAGLLLTTHSPHVAAVAPLHSLVLLSRETQNGGTVASTTLNAAVTAKEEQDLARYLDVTRAEILFARVVVLVEGIAEAYVLPALARAAGFDLDAYGVVVASVAGTDFGPYHRVCGESAFAIPHIVITDGDRTVGRGFLGLRRAAPLLPVADATTVSAGVTALRAAHEPDDEDTDEADEETAVDALLAEEVELVNLAARSHVYVGDDTLEIDLAPLLGVEMKQAYVDLRAPGRALFATAVDRLMSGESDDDDYRRVIRLVDRVGKGRYAQRLAGHISALPSGELSRRVLDLAGEGYETEDISSAEVADDLLLDSGSPAYLLRALNALSQIVRDLPLFLAPAEAEQAGG